MKLPLWFILLMACLSASSSAWAAHFYAYSELDEQAVRRLNATGICMIDAGGCLPFIESSKPEDFNSVSATCLAYDEPTKSLAYKTPGDIKLRRWNIDNGPIAEIGIEFTDEFGTTWHGHVRDKPIRYDERAPELKEHKGRFLCISPGGGKTGAQLVGYRYNLHNFTGPENPHLILTAKVYADGSESTCMNPVETAHLCSEKQETPADGKLDLNRLRKNVNNALPAANSDPFKNK